MITLWVHYWKGQYNVENSSMISFHISLYSNTSTEKKILFTKKLTVAGLLAILLLEKLAGPGGGPPDGYGAYKRQNW